MARLRRLRPVLVLAAAAGVVALLWARGPDWGSVGHALAEMEWSWAAVAIVLNLLSAIARALSWRTVVVEAVPRPHPRLLDLFSAFFIGIFANGILPGRIGEVARIGVLVRRMPQRRGLWGALLGSVVAHRLLEIFPSLALIVWVLFVAKVPAWGRVALWSVFAAGAAVFVIGIVLARRYEREHPLELGRVRAGIESVRRGLAVMRTPGAALRATWWQTAGWALQLAAVWTAMRAFHLVLPLAAAGVVLALMNVALILPLWPGNVGLQQAAIALPLLSYDVPYAHGFAYGIGLQAIESSVGYVLGVAFLLREGIGLRALRHRLAPDEAPLSR